MSIRDDLRVAARSLVLALTPATDGKVIYAGVKGNRPALPYLTVRITAPTSQIFAEESLVADNMGTPEETQVQHSAATVSLQGYGSTSYDWLHTLQVRLNSTAGLTAQGAAGVDASILTPLRDLSTLLDTSEEARSSLELRLFYLYVDDPVAQAPLSRMEVDLELRRYDGDPDTLDASFALDGSGAPVP